MTNPAETLRQKASRLLDEYNALHDESAYAEAKRAYQQLLAEYPDCAGLHLEYGMLQDWHGRRSIRAAVACYERAIELDPGQDAPHFQLTHSRAALNETEHVIDLYKKRLAAAPDQIREYRFLARAYLYAGAREEAGKVIAAGRKLDPGGYGLLELEAELLDASGRKQEALAIWQTFKQRGDPENLEPYYMSAFALEAMGRYQEAIAEWRYIIDWHEAHDHAIHTEWPKEMIAGIEAKIAAADPSADGTRS